MEEKVVTVAPWRVSGLKGTNHPGWITRMQSWFMMLSHRLYPQQIEVLEDLMVSQNWRIHAVEFLAQGDIVHITMTQNVGFTYHVIYNRDMLGEGFRVWNNNDFEKGLAEPYLKTVEDTWRKEFDYMVPKTKEA